MILRKDNAKYSGNNTNIKMITHPNLIAYHSFVFTIIFNITDVNKIRKKKTTENNESYL